MLNFKKGVVETREGKRLLVGNKGTILVGKVYLDFAFPTYSSTKDSHFYSILVSSQGLMGPLVKRLVWFGLVFL